MVLQTHETCFGLFSYLYGVKMKNILLAVSIGAIISVGACSQEVEQKPVDDTKNVVVGPETSSEWFDAGAAKIAEIKAQVINTNKAKNVILFVGDGMGISTLTAARILEGQLRGETGEENLLSFEEFPHTALVKTYNTDAQISDSAGTASAFNTGMKTRSGVISVGPEQPHAVCKGSEKYFSPLLAERLEEAGYATGIVSTAKITHATPAAVYAHSATRGWEADYNLSEEAAENGCEDIASQLLSFDDGDGIDLAIGGGRAAFLPGKRKDGRDLTKEWVASAESARYVSNAQELAAATPENTSRLLGLFTDSHMSYEADRQEGEPSLTDMTEKAISFLDGKGKGYYLMVEAGRVDHAHHGGNAYRSLHDAVELSSAVRKAMEMVDLNETMIMVTADHSHVFTMAGYADRGNPIFGVSKNNGEAAKAKDGEAYTTLGYGNGPGYIEGKRPELTNDVTRHKDYQQQAAVPMDSETHAGEDVALFAVGPWSHLVRGTIEQNVIYHYMVNALGLNEEEKAE